jgi:hypothetical protein
MKDTFNEELSINDTVIVTCSNGSLPKKGKIVGFTKTMVRVDIVCEGDYWSNLSNRNPDRLIKYS